MPRLAFKTVSRCQLGRKVEHLSSHIGRQQPDSLNNSVELLVKGFRLLGVRHKSVSLRHAEREDGRISNIDIIIESRTKYVAAN